MRYSAKYDAGPAGENSPAQGEASIYLLPLDMRCYTRVGIANAKYWLAAWQVMTVCGMRPCCCIYWPGALYNIVHCYICINIGFVH